MEVAIIGGGSFGTAIANIAAGDGVVTHRFLMTGGKPVDVAFAMPAVAPSAAAP